MTDDELSSHIQQGTLKIISPVDDVINDDACIGVVVNGDAVRFCQFLPNTIDVVDKVDKGCRAISWPEWHDGVSPLDRVNPLECQFSWLARSTAS